MFGNRLNDFMDDMYHNPEKEILCCGKRYMITGFIDKLGELYTLEVYTIEQESKTIFTVTSKDRHECVEMFAKAKIFNGKTVYEAEKEIEVLYG